MTPLPPFLSPSPEQEALELGLDYVIFDPLAVDARTRAEAKDDETPPTLESDKPFGQEECKGGT